MNDVELIIGLEKQEINLWRLANSQRATQKGMGSGCSVPAGESVPETLQVYGEEVRL
jgi:hypothetical protein